MDRRECLGAVAALFGGVVLPDVVRELVRVELDPLRIPAVRTLPEWRGGNITAHVNLPAIHAAIRRENRELLKGTRLQLYGLTSPTGALLGHIEWTTQEPRSIGVERGGEAVEFGR